MAVRSAAEAQALIALLKKKRGGDPFGVASDPELQQVAVDAAAKRYVEMPTDENFRRWQDVLLATERT